MDLQPPRAVKQALPERLFVFENSPTTIWATSRMACA